MPPFASAVHAASKLCMSACEDYPTHAAKLDPGSSLEELWSSLTSQSALARPCVEGEDLELPISHCNRVASLDSVESLFREIADFVHGAGGAQLLASPKRVCPLSFGDVSHMKPSAHGVPAVVCPASVWEGCQKQAAAEEEQEAPLARPERSNSGSDLSAGEPETAGTGTQAEKLAQSLVAEGVTTLMIRNIPAAATQATFLMELGQSGFSGHFDFCYLPCQFETRENRGYAFINLLSSAALARFVSVWHGSRRLGVLPSERALNVKAAAVQGLEANTKRWGGRMHRIRNSELRPFIATPESSREPSPTPADLEKATLSAPASFLRPPPGLPPPPSPAPGLPPPGLAPPTWRASLPIGADPAGEGVPCKRRGSR